MKHLYVLMILPGIGILSNSVVAAEREPFIVKIQGDGEVFSKPSGITCPTDCFENYREKITVTLTASAKPGSTFSGWSGACAGVEPVCAIKIKKHSVITATFSKK